MVCGCLFVVGWSVMFRGVVCWWLAVVCVVCARCAIAGGWLCVGVACVLLCGLRLLVVVGCCVLCVAVRVLVLVVCC